MSNKNRSRTDSIIYNQFNLTAFSSYKTNNTKNDIINIENKKDNLGINTKNFWTSDVKSTDYISRLNNFCLTSKYKNNSSPSITKLLNKLK